MTRSGNYANGRAAGTLWPRVRFVSWGVPLAPLSGILLHGRLSVQGPQEHGGKLRDGQRALRVEAAIADAVDGPGRPEGGEEAFLAREMAWNATRYDMAAMLYQVLEADADGEAQAWERRKTPGPAPPGRGPPDAGSIPEPGGCSGAFSS